MTSTSSGACRAWLGRGWDAAGIGQMRRPPLAPRWHLRPLVIGQGVGGEKRCGDHWVLEGEGSPEAPRNWVEGGAVLGARAGQCWGAGWDSVGGPSGAWAAQASCSFLSETVDQAVETYGLQKITLLREISLKTGIQVGTAQRPHCVPLHPRRVPAAGSHPRPGTQGRWLFHSSHLCASIGGLGGANSEPGAEASCVWGLLSRSC